MTKDQSTSAGDARFRVSDVYEIPLRGYMLRLKLLEGTPSMKVLRKGNRLRVEAPNGGETRLVTIQDLGAASGRAREERLAQFRELDVVVSREDALSDAPVEIGWYAAPATGRGS